jgi:SAM-dependent methyltransferase
MPRHSATDDEWLVPYVDRLTHSMRDTCRILELGCGEGRDTAQLGKLGDVVAVDLGEASLRLCRQSVPGAMLICADLSHRLPIRTGAFSTVVASLSLHYFSWETSRRLVAEIRRVMTRDGMLIVRVNSTRDTEHGAVGHAEIEPNFYNVAGASKRFFDRRSVLDLFGGWKIDAMEERCIMRYARPKWIWEMCLHAA